MIDINKLDNQLKTIQEELNPLVSVLDYKSQIANIEKQDIDKDNFFYLRPIAVKDNYNIKNSLTTASSYILNNYISPYSAFVINKIIDKGAIVVAKTSLDEFGMGGTNKNAYTGPVLNPFDKRRISGGSSGGSAVMVAKGVVDFALGSDTGDSVRKPAGFCGIVGVKPTYGLISRYGVIPYASSLDHVAYFTTNVKDAAKALNELVGRDDQDMTSLDIEPINYYENLNDDISHKKIAILANVTKNITNQDVLKAFNDTVDKLKETGTLVEEVNVDDKIIRSCLAVYNIIANCEACANHANLDGLRFGLQEDGSTVEEIIRNSRTKGFSSLLKKRFIMGAYALDEDNQERLLRKAQKVRRVISETFNEVFKEYDAIVAPSSSDIAPELDDVVSDELSDRYLICENYMVYANFMGLPSITVPMGKSQGLPLGINITTQRLDEETMFNIALAVEEKVAFKRWEND